MILSNWEISTSTLTIPRTETKTAHTTLRLFGSLPACLSAKTPTWSYPWLGDSKVSPLKSCSIYHCWNSTHIWPLPPDSWDKQVMTQGTPERDRIQKHKRNWHDILPQKIWLRESELVESPPRNVAQLTVFFLLENYSPETVERVPDRPASAWYNSYQPWC